MSRKSDDLVPVFMPSLGAVLLAAEDGKGSPLTEAEAIAVRNKSTCVMMKRNDAEIVAQGRGGDVDPENCWHDFQHLRRRLGRKPDLDPGARIVLFADDDSEMAQAMEDARKSLGKFRKLMAQAAAKGAMPLVKTLVTEGRTQVFLWLREAVEAATGFRGRVFEVPAGIKKLRVGDTVDVSAEEVADWMVNDHGTIHGAFSIRVHRSRLSEMERAEFDEHMGARKFV